MEKNTNTTQDDVRASVASLYTDLLNKRRSERAERKAKRQEEKAIKEEEKDGKYIKEDGSKMTKKEKREAQIASWQAVVMDLTGDDLEYTKPKKNKKKYKKWIDDEDLPNLVVEKPKKIKKKNYQKEFEPELNMLKAIVADQNKFTAELLKRFQNAAGPATRDASPLNKTLVELASAINASRSNSLGLIREIGGLKKTVAELYMKQKKMDEESGGNGFNTQDIGLVGSSMAAALFGDNKGANNYSSNNDYSSPSPSSDTNTTVNSGPVVLNGIAEKFDPDSWEGVALSEGDNTKYEQIPHHIVVEWHKDENKARFKAVNDATGEEIKGYNTPSEDPRKLSFNEKDMTVKGQFDQVYKLEIV